MSMALTAGKGGAVEQFPYNLCNATAVLNTVSQLYHNIHCKTEGYICCICFGIFTPLAPPLPPNRSGKRVTEACSTATLPSFFAGWGLSRLALYKREDRHALVVTCAELLSRTRTRIAASVS
jgi:hypothetical protein